MGRVLLFTVLLYLAALITGIADCLGSEEEPRRFRRGIWALLIVVLPIAGTVLWFTHGRPTKKRRSARARSGPVAPDDDPQFLADLERRLRDDQN
ncbi:MAG TPA: PLD nuclease N-terminal domain-containing protein [Candidatus Stackebrandtia faecavium]|nr:PLD nuclease N-terminal domain-containing protein [Candidatus Stackebrandtia faecavium]